MSKMTIPFGPQHPVLPEPLHLKLVMEDEIVTVDKAAATWALDPMACICCGICVAACPKDCLRQTTAYHPVGTAREQVVLQGEVRPRQRKDAPAGEAKQAA